MPHSLPSPRAVALAALALAAPAAPATLAAQPPATAPARQGAGRIVGRVTDADGRAVGGAQVQVEGTTHRALSDDDGRYRIGGVPDGRYTLRVTRIGQRARTVPDVAVRAGEETTADVVTEGSAVAIGGVVVSASRRVEKVTDAPATVTAIGTAQLDQTVGNIFAGALKEAKGVDFIQTGMTTVAINARGFNSSFNNRFLMVEDGRIAVLPENGLPVGQFTATPKVDLAGMEVLVGPGSALYGPDAANGVLSLRTKDPRQFPGATLEVSGGTRSYRDIQARYAGVTGAGRGQLGFKASGEYQAANDFSNYLKYGAGGAVAADTATVGVVREDALKVPIDWQARVARGTGAVVYYRGEQRLELSGGMSRTNGVGQTNVGRNQLRDWGYNTTQLRWSTPHWYANVYRAQSTSGESFALNRFAGAQLLAANAGLGADSLRMLSDWPSDGRMYAGELQGNYTLGALLGTSVVFGGQYRDDVVSSKRQWLTDRVTNRDVKNGVRGLYAQTTTPLGRWADVVLAGRYDWPTAFDAQWSPKAGVVLKPMADQAFRVTYNRAYKTPTILQTNFFIPDWTSIISIYGNTDGFTIRNAAGAQVGDPINPVRPESNRTWEYGYKGVIAGRLYVDATYFDARYQDFLSPLSIIANPFATAAAGGPTYAFPTANPNGIPVNAQGRIVNAAGVTPITLAYYNTGEARLRGTDIGVNYFVVPGLELRGTLSTVDLRSAQVTRPGASLEAVALNSPGTKWTLGATASRLGPVTAGVTWRNVNGYYFRSGVNSGVIPTFGAADVTLSYRLPTVGNPLLNLSVSNLFSCTSEDVTFTTPAGGQPNSAIRTQDRGCGFNRSHREMVNMPYIGTMAFLGLRLQR
jgi:iron complex outermembrane receptor protein